MNSEMSTLRRISLINFTGIRPNWGCQATSWEWLKFINSAFPADSLPEVSLVPLLPRHEMDRVLERDHLHAIYDAVEHVAAARPGRADKLAFLESTCRSRYGRYADAVAASDIVFFQAEGSMTGTDMVRGVRLILLPFVAKHAWGKPVYAFNHTVFICDERFKTIAAAAFNSFDLNAVRETISLSAGTAGGMNPVHYIPDAAFLTEPAFDDRLPHLADGHYFAVTGSASPMKDIHREIFSAADRVRLATGLTPLIAASTKADRALISLAEDQWPKGGYAVVPHHVGYAAVAHALRSCAFILGGRYHLAILAASVGTPAIQVRGNSYKNEGLSAMLGGVAPVRDPADVDRIVQDALDLVHHLDEAKERLAASRKAIAGSFASARDWLAKRLSGRAAAIPQSFVSPPGVPIDHRHHSEPYCSQATEQVVSLRYSTDSDAAMGELPQAGNILPAITASCLAGQPAAIALLRQLCASYPDLRAKVGESDHPLHGLVY